VSNRNFAYWKALAAATTSVKGKGGGARQATTKASVDCLAIFVLRYSNRLGLIVRFKPSWPPFRQTRSRSRTPIVDPADADSTYNGRCSGSLEVRTTNRKSLPNGKNKNDESRMPSTKRPRAPRCRR